MARDGSGNYSRVVTPPSNGDIADADDFNAEINDIATALSDSINRSGTKAFAADQSMGGYKLTNLAAPTNANDAARKTYVDTAISALSSSYQPLDADLTAIAALSHTSGTQAITTTAPSTYALSTFGTAAGQNTGTSGATVPLLNGNNTHSGNNTFSAAVSCNAGVTSRVDGSQANFAIRRAATSGATQLAFQLNDSGGNNTDYSRIVTSIVDATDTSEDGQLNIQVIVAGTLTSQLTLAGSSATFANPVLAPAGSAAAPSLAGSGDSDTGIRFPGSNVGYLVAGASDEIQWTTTALSPVTNDGNALGTTTLGWADVHLATGGVLNWANGNFTATHSSGALAFSGAISATTVTARVIASSETTGTLTSASANEEIYATGDITIPASVFVAGDKVRIYAGAISRTITQGGGGTQRLGGTSTTGNLTLAARGWALVEFISATEWTVSGDVS